MGILQGAGAMSFTAPQPDVTICEHSGPPTDMEQLTLARQLVLDDPCEAVRLMKRSSSQVIHDYVSAHVDHAKWTTARYAKHLFHLRPDRSAPEYDNVCVICGGHGWSQRVAPAKGRLTRHGLPLDGDRCCHFCDGQGQYHGHPWIGVNQSFYSITGDGRTRADITITRSWWRLHWIPAASVTLRLLSNGGLPWHYGQSMTMLHRFDVETRGQLVCDLRHGSHNCKQLAERIKAAPVWSKDKPDAELNRLWTGHLAKAPHPDCWCAMCTRARYGGAHDHEGTCDYCPAALADASQHRQKG
jgi:hypothetical protein